MTSEPASSSFSGSENAALSRLRTGFQLKMKPDIHPEYHPVVFRDASNGKAFLTRSTMTSDKTIKWEDGNEYPLINLEISGTSHPFYTGTQRMVDTAGRVERFQQRYGMKKGGTSDKSAAPAPTKPPEEDASAE